MKLFSLSILALWLHLTAFVLAQGSEGPDLGDVESLPYEPLAECTRQLAATLDCADVINPNACYNQYKFSGTRTLSCIEGKDDADRARKACRCARCVSAAMVTWVQNQRYCNNVATTPTTGKGKAGRRAVVREF